MKVPEENVGKHSYNAIVFDENNRSTNLVDNFTFISIINLIMFPVIWVETL
jgi:hypothetical protein